MVHDTGPAARAPRRRPQHGVSALDCKLHLGMGKEPELLASLVKELMDGK